MALHAPGQEAVHLIKPLYVMRGEERHLAVFKTEETSERRREAAIAGLL